jgi:ABC-type transport system substrate-binding protein
MANCSAAPLDNKLVRQALNYSFDRQRFVNTILAGIGDPSATPWPPQSPAYDRTKAAAYAFNLDKAKSLLDQAGVSNLQLELLADPAFPPLSKFGEVLQSDLGKIGVKLTVTTPESAVFQKRSDAKDYQLISDTFAYADLEPSSLMVMAVPWLSQNNQANFTSSDYVKLVESTVSEMDAAKRKTLDAQLTDFILDQSFTMPLARRKGSLVTNAKVHGPAFRVATTQVIRLEDAWLES